MSVYRPDGQQSFVVEFPDHRGVRRRVTAFRDRGLTRELARRIRLLVDTKRLGIPPDAELVRWLEGLQAKTRAKLAKFGLLDARRLEASRPLIEHVKDFEESMRAKGDSPVHVIRCGKRVREILRRMRAVYLSDLRGSAAAGVLNDLKDRNFANRTVNGYMGALRAFARWLVRDGRVAENPVGHLPTLNPQTDRRKVRRVLNADEIRKLLAAAASGPVVIGVRGFDRAMLYRLAVETGLRAAEIKSLTRASFDFDSDPPTVTVAASYSKHRRTDVLPLRPDTASALRDYLALKMPSAPAFPTPSLYRWAEMLRRDLAAAGIPARDDTGRVLDFHALRHTFITSLARSGVHPKTAQTLARHCSITLTLDVYSHSIVQDQTEALARLPSLDTPNREAAPATGTEGTLSDRGENRGDAQGPATGRPDTP